MPDGSNVTVAAGDGSLRERLSQGGKCAYGTFGAAFAGMLAGGSAGAAIANAVFVRDLWKALVIIAAAVIGLLGGFCAGASLACYRKDEP